MHFIYTCQYFNPRTRRSRCDTSLIILPLSLVLFQSTHPKIRMRPTSRCRNSRINSHFNPRIRRPGLSEHHPDGYRRFQSTYPKIRMRPANNGLVKPLQKFTAKTKCFEFTKVSPNKTFTWINWCETPVTFMCNSGSHAFLRQQFSSKDHSKTSLPLLYCPIWNQSSNVLNWSSQPLNQY